MNIRVTFNAQLRDRLGCSDADLQLADDASTEDLFTTLRERHEGLFEADGSLRRAVMLFINGKQQRPNQSAPLSDGAECAFLTPISGG